MNHLKLTLPLRRQSGLAGVCQRGRGVSLIEILVSVLIITLGVMGSARLQAVALRNNQSSYETTQATITVQGLFDAMRSNLGAVTAGNYNTSGWVCTAPTGATLAARDLARWLNGLQAQIGPGTCGNVACAANACTVQVRWDDSRATQGVNARVATMAVQL